MHVTIVNVQVKPEHIDAFIEATRLNHEASTNEPGNLRFDVLQSEKETATFILYEAYQNQEHALAHKETSHYLRWRDTVKDWMAVPREGVVYTGLLPLFD